MLPTAKQPKRKLRHEDILEFTAAVLNPNLGIMNNYLVCFIELYFLLLSDLAKRIETMTFACTLFALGLRPGTILEQPEYAAKGEVLKWKVHVIIVIQLFSPLQIIGHGLDHHRME